MNIENFDQLLSMMPDKLRDMVLSLKQINERDDYHPEDNVFEHTKIVVNRCIATGDIDLVLAGFFHDIFKFKLNKVNEKTGYNTAIGHEREAALLVLSMGDLIVSFGGDVGMVAAICLDHMRVKLLKEMRKSKREQLMKQPHFRKLLIFSQADDMLNTDPMPKMGYIP
jgi:hypothetical protein